MKAIGVTTYGGPEVLHVIDLADPHPGPGEVRISVRAAGINPIDVMLREGHSARMYAGYTPPFVPGWEVSGVIDEVGEGCGPHIELGMDAVAFVNPIGQHGGYSEYVVLPATAVTRSPTGRSHAEAASFLNNALTARHTLDSLALGPGSSLLVTGAAGAVGGYLTQLAAHDGLMVVAVASASDEELVRSYGASMFLPRGDDIVDRIRAQFPAGVDAIADAAVLDDVIVPALRDGGRLAAFRGVKNDPGRGITAIAINVRERATDHAAIVTLRELVDSGDLHTRVARTFPIAEVSDAHRHFEKERRNGRIILEFPTPGA